MAKREQTIGKSTGKNKTKMIVYNSREARRVILKMIKTNMLTNPFEKFERKRFLYHSKDLGVISMNHALFSKLDEADLQRVRKQMQEDILNYYKNM